MMVRMWRKGNPCTLLVGMEIDASTVENSMEASQKTNNRTTIWHSNSTLGYITKRERERERTLIPTCTCTPMFIPALFTIAKMWKQPKCPSTDEWIKKMWFICTVEYYSAIKKDEILPFATIWIDLESLMLSELSQSEKDKYCMISEK